MGEEVESGGGGGGSGGGGDSGGDMSLVEVAMLTQQ